MTAQYLCTCSCCRRESGGGLLWTRVERAPSSIAWWRRTSWLSERGYDVGGTWRALRYPWGVFVRDDAMRPCVRLVPTVFLLLMKVRSHGEADN